MNWRQPASTQTRKRFRWTVAAFGSLVFPGLAHAHAQLYGRAKIVAGVAIAMLISAMLGVQQALPLYLVLIPLDFIGAVLGKKNDVASTAKSFPGIIVLVFSLPALALVAHKAMSVELPFRHGPRRAPIQPTDADGLMTESHYERLESGGALAGSDLLYVLEHFPNDPRAHLHAARGAVRAHRAELADEHFARALTLAPRYASVLGRDQEWWIRVEYTEFLLNEQRDRYAVTIIAPVCAEPNSEARAAALTLGACIGTRSCVPPRPCNRRCVRDAADRRSTANT